MISHLEKFIDKYGRLPTEVDPDYLEMLKMSKYRILTRPDANTAKCANCGGFKEDGRRYVDFGLFVDWYGVVFLCSICIKELATQLGLLNTEEKIEVDPMPELKEEVKNTISKLEEILKEFHEYSDSLNIDNSDPPDLEHSPDDNDVSPASESGTNKAEQRAAKSTTSTGRKNVRSLTELLDSSGK